MKKVYRRCPDWNDRGSCRECGEGFMITLDGMRMNDVGVAVLSFVIGSSYNREAVHDRYGAVRTGSSTISTLKFPPSVC